MNPAKSTLIERYFVVQFPKVDDRDRCDLSGKIADGLRQAYPACFVNNAPRWAFTVAAGESGAPQLDDLQMGEVTDLWEVDEQEEHRPALWRVRIEDDKVVVNYRKQVRTDPGSFEELQALMDQVLPLCRASLSCREWEVTLHYLFHFDCSTVPVPGLVKPGRIEVRELLQPFAALPEPEGFKFFLPDYRWTQKWLQTCDGREYVAGADVSTLKSPDLAIRLDLAVGTDRRVVKDGIFKDLFQVLKANAERLFAPNAWAELRGDCI